MGGPRLRKPTLPNMKICGKCNEEKSVTLFGKNSRASDGLFSWCKSCASQNSKDYRLKNPEKLSKSFKAWVEANPEYHKQHKKKWARENPDMVRNVAIKSKFGIDQTVYEKMLKDQDGKCAICGTLKPGGRGGKHFAIDHDHITGTVRALLCSACNAVLGLMKENPEGLRAAAEYLEYFRGL